MSAARAGPPGSLTAEAATVPKPIELLDAPPDPDDTALRRKEPGAVQTTL